MKPAKPKVIFVRHISTALNSARADKEPERIRGQSDPPPIPEGIEQAKQIGEKLAKKPIAKIYTSPLQRATVLAVAIQKAHPNNPSLEARQELLPWDTGYLTGKEVEPNWPIILKYEIERPQIAPQGGEPYEVFKRRCLGFVMKVLSEARQGAHRGAVCVVWHSRNMDLLEAWKSAGMKGYQIDTEVLRKGPQLSTGEGWEYEFEYQGQRWLEDEVDYAPPKNKAANAGPKE